MALFILKSGFNNSKVEIIRYPCEVGDVVVGAGAGVVQGREHSGLLEKAHLRMIFIFTNLNTLGLNSQRI